MKTRESLLTDCKNQTRKIVVKFYLWEKFKVAGCWEIFSGLRKKKGGGGSETKNQCSNSLSSFYKIILSINKITSKAKRKALYLHNSNSVSFFYKIIYSA